MADLDEKIAKLEAEIDEYAAQLKAVKTEKELDIFTGSINSTREALNLLLDMKKAQISGTTVCNDSLFLILLIFFLVSFIYFLLTIRSRTSR